MGLIPNFTLYSLDYYKSIIDTAVANNEWLIFMSHLRTDVDSNGVGTYYCDEDTKDLLVDVCKYIAQSGAKLVTLSEGYDAFKNRIDCGSLEDESYYIVDRDGVVHEI